MTLTKNHRYFDKQGDEIYAEEVYDDSTPTSTAYLGSTGAYVRPEFAAPLALNILGHDRPDDDPLAVKFSVGIETAHIASSPGARDSQLNLAAALLMAVDAYDRRKVRLASAAERRAAAAKSLTDSVIRLRNDGPGPFTGDEIGKLREALGRFDAALAN